MIRACSICHAAFDAKGRTLTCSIACSREQKNKRKREYRLADKDEINKRTREYRSAHKDEIAKYRREHRLAHIDEYKRREHKCRLAHRDETNKRAREWRAANYLRFYRLRREWRMRNREKVSERQRNILLAYQALKQLGITLDHLPTLSSKRWLAYQVLQQHFPGVLPNTQEK